MGCWAQLRDLLRVAKAVDVGRGVRGFWAMFELSVEIFSKGKPMEKVSVNHKDDDSIG